jgi:hypothetical protein
VGETLEIECISDYLDTPEVNKLVCDVTLLGDPHHVVHLLIRKMKDDCWAGQDKTETGPGDGTLSIPIYT